MRPHQQTSSSLIGDDFAEQIDELANRVERLIVSHRAPEYFFEEKSEIADSLRRIATEVHNG